MQRNSDGNVTVIVILVLAAITILGIMSINTTTVELLITRNEREAREILYLAESGAMEGVQRLVNADPADLGEKHLAWHCSAKQAESAAIDFMDAQAWDYDGRQEDNAIQSAFDPKTYIAAVERRIAPGSSLIVTGSRLYLNQVFGLSTQYHTDNIIEMGYYLRY